MLINAVRRTYENQEFIEILYSTMDESKNQF